MEKLRQLLNDYEDYKEKETGYSNYDWRLNQIDDEEEKEERITAFRVDDSQLGVEESIAVIICKGYCFIEWLVENDRVKPLGKFIGWETDEDEPYIQFDLVDQYIAYLSIQDNPIEFLISILK